MNKNQSLISSLKRAVTAQAPDVYNRVAHQPVRKDIEVFSSAPARSRPIWAAAASMLTVALFLFGGWFMLLRVDSTIDLDVNPSVEIKINRFERVIGLEPLNEDAIPIVSGIGFKNLKLERVVNAVIGSMYYHGYLESPESAILITVDNQDQARASDLEMNLSIEIGKITQLGNDKIFSQTVSSNEALAETAERLGVSRGMMQLMLQAQAQHPQISLLDLSCMPISELYRLAQGLPPTSLQDDLPPAKTPEELILWAERSGAGPKPTQQAPPASPGWLPWDDDDDDDDDFWDDDDVWDDDEIDDD